ETRNSAQGLGKARSSTSSSCISPDTLCHIRASVLKTCGASMEHQACTDTLSACCPRQLQGRAKTPKRKGFTMRMGLVLWESTSRTDLEQEHCLTAPDPRVRHPRSTAKPAPPSINPHRSWRRVSAARSPVHGSEHTAEHWPDRTVR